MDVESIKSIRSEAARLGYMFCAKCRATIASDTSVLKEQEGKGWRGQCPECGGHSEWFGSTKEADEDWREKSDKTDLLLMAEQAHERGYSLMEYKMLLADFRKVVQVKREYERLPDSERVDGVLAELRRKADMCRIAHYTEANVKEFFRILDEQKVIWDKETKRIKEETGVVTISDIPYFNEPIQNEGNDVVEE